MSRVQPSGEYLSEFLVDVSVADTVANLKAAGKIKYIGSFAGNLD